MYIYVSFLIVKAVPSPSANCSTRPEGFVSSLSLRDSWEDVLPSLSIKRHAHPRTGSSLTLPGRAQERRGSIFCMWPNEQRAVSTQPNTQEEEESQRLAHIIATLTLPAFSVWANGCGHDKKVTIPSSKEGMLFGGKGNCERKWLISAGWKQAMSVVWVSIYTAFQQ